MDGDRDRRADGLQASDLLQGRHPRFQAEISRVDDHRGRGEQLDSAALFAGDHHGHREGFLDAVQCQGKRQIGNNRAAIGQGCDQLRGHRGAGSSRGEGDRFKQHLPHTLIANRDQGLDAVQADRQPGHAILAEVSLH